MDYNIPINERTRLNPIWLGRDNLLKMADKELDVRCQKCCKDIFTCFLEIDRRKAEQRRSEWIKSE